MNVLVVEDDKALGLFLQKGLRLEGHDVDWVADGVAALAHASERRPSLAVLDLGLPCLDGTDVLRSMRKDFSEMAILVLTGRGQVEERIACLNLGADDYMTKPFSFLELTARVRAISRRRETSGNALLRYGAVEMNRMNRRVQRDGFNAELTGKEFALLEYLLEKRGACCSREDLLRDVWGMSPEASTNVVDVYINYLRRKLAAAHPDGQSSPPVIETIRGQGYRLANGRKPPVNAAMISQPRPAVLYPLLGAA